MNESKNAALQLAGYWSMPRADFDRLTNRFAFGGFGFTGDDDDDDDAGYTIDDNGIASVPIMGVMVKESAPWNQYFGLVSTQDVIAAIQAALQDNRSKSLRLVIDSCGGTVAGSNLLADYIATVNQQQTPVDCVIQDHGLSAAYLVAVQCRSIVANDVALVGSIGTFSVLSDISGMLKQMGVDRTVVSSGGIKGAGADGRVTDALVADEQRIITGLNEVFIEKVARGRNVSEQKVRGWADGTAVLARDAQRQGLIDGVIGSPAQYSSQQPIGSTAGPTAASAVEGYARRMARGLGKAYTPAAAANSIPETGPLNGFQRTALLKKIQLDAARKAQ